MSFTLRIFFEILTGFNFQSMSIFLVDLLWLDMSGATISVRSQNGSELEGVVWSSLSLSLSQVSAPNDSNPPYSWIHLIMGGTSAPTSLLWPLVWKKTVHEVR